MRGREREREPPHTYHAPPESRENREDKMKQHYTSPIRGTAGYRMNILISTPGTHSLPSPTLRLSRSVVIHSPDTRPSYQEVEGSRPVKEVEGGDEQVTKQEYCEDSVMIRVTSCKCRPSELTTGASTGSSVL